MAKKSAAKAPKKATGRATPKKKSATPATPLRATSAGGFIHVQFSDGSERKFAPVTLDTTLHKYFMLEQVHMDSGELVIPFRGSELRLDARRLAEGNGTHETEAEEFTRRFQKILQVIDNFGPYVLKQLKRRGMTVGELEKKANLGQSNFSRYSRGAKPTIETALKVLKAMSIPIDKL